MLSFALILAVCSTAFEMIIASKWDWWRTKAAHSLLVCGVGSIVLSYVLGVAFGAHGLIGMTAGIMSTVMSAMCYPILELYLKHKTEIAGYKTRSRAWLERNIQTLADFGRFLMSIVRLVTLPFRIIRFFMNLNINNHPQPKGP